MTSKFFIVAAALFFTLAQITGVGYGLYLWGVENYLFSYSAWEGFVVWLQMMGAGVVSLALAIWAP